MGGLSGKPLIPITIPKVRKFYEITQGSIPIIGCGGIWEPEHAIQYAKAGASLVQLYTSLGYEGPGVVAEIKEGVVDYLKKEGKTWKDLVGADHRK
jgi:dihydroorotate dehydrogenase